MMQLSAEMRWFWQGTIPSSFEQWFHGFGGCPPGGGQTRLDVYLYEQGQRELGLKKRGTKPGIEVKGLIATLPMPVALGPLHGHIELWSKWTSSELRLHGVSLLSTSKTRWMRKYDTGNSRVIEIELREDESPKNDAIKLPENGCNVELTSLVVEPARQVWWTVGCEAFGPSLELVEQNLRMIINTIPPKNIPAVKGGMEASYPAWMSTLSL
jgi:hypothetical protein